MPISIGNTHFCPLLFSPRYFLICFKVTVGMSQPCTWCSLACLLHGTFLNAEKKTDFFYRFRHSSVFLFQVKVDSIWVISMSVVGTAHGLTYLDFLFSILEKRKGKKIGRNFLINLSKRRKSIEGASAFYFTSEAVFCHFSGKCRACNFTAENFIFFSSLKALNSLLFSFSLH